MHPRIHEVLTYLDEQRAALTTALDDVPPSLRSERPGPGQWSVAEVLEHLVIVETRIAALLDTKIRAARAVGLGPEQDTTPVMPTVDVAALLDRSSPRTASAASLPTGVHDPDTSWHALRTARERTKTMIADVDGLALGDVVIDHARLGPINVYQWLLFLAAHEGRHAGQIRDVMSRLTAD